MFELQPTGPGDIHAIYQTSVLAYVFTHIFHKMELHHVRDTLLVPRGGHPESLGYKRTAIVSL